MKFLVASALVLGVASAQIPAVPIIEKIAPDTANCDGSDPEGCATADQVAPWVAHSLFQYKIYDINAMAAIVSNMAFESEDFKYRRNLVPDHYGQGTANMQNAEFNLQYAKTLPGVKNKVKDITWETLNDGSDAMNKKKNDILGLLVPDQYNFATGAWYFSDKCSETVRQTLHDDPDAGFKLFITDCVKTTITDERIDKFNLAKEAFGVKDKSSGSGSY